MSKNHINTGDNSEKIEPLIGIPPNERVFHHNEYSLQNLEGKLLTIIDASFSDEIQRKAVKDLISQVVWKWQWEFDSNFANHPEWANQSTPMSKYGTH